MSEIIYEKTTVAFAACFLHFCVNILFWSALVWVTILTTPCCAFTVLTDGEEPSLPKRIVGQKLNNTKRKTEINLYWLMGVYSIDKFSAGSSADSE